VKSGLGQNNAKALGIWEYEFSQLWQAKEYHIKDVVFEVSVVE
jgi:hypothetical protein